MRSNIILSALLCLGLVVLGFGQGCDPLGNDSLSIDSGNGDFYGGYKPTDAELSSSIQSVADSLKSIVDDTAPESPIDLQPGECAPLVQASCQNNVRFAVYDQCKIPGKESTLKGIASLKYTHPSCDIFNSGDSVISTYGISIKAVNGYSVLLSSLEHLTFTGEKIGGGGVLTKDGPQWNFELKGKRIVVLNPKGIKRADYSQRTLEPVIFGSGIYSDLYVQSGTLQVDHNLEKMSVIYKLNEVNWDASCCHPIAGKLSIEFKGAYTGFAVAEYESCGVVQLNMNGELKALKLKSCE